MLNIVHYPHPSLSQKTKEVLFFDEQLHSFAQEMLDTMYEKRGIGLAANQVNSSKRMFVLRSENADYVFVNPIILNYSSSTEPFTEGCLSFPGVTQKKYRAQYVKLQWQDLNGEIHIQDFSHLDAICIQHEMDHLNGITFIDDLSSLKKQIILKKYKKNTAI